MTRKLLFGVALLALAACVKEEVRPEEFSAVVKGRSWIVSNDNKTIRISKSSYDVVVSHDNGDSTRASLDVYDPDEAVFSSFHLDIKDFKGSGTYTKLDAYGTLVVGRQGNITTYNTFVLDNSKPKKVVVEKYNKGDNIKGIFKVTLKPEFSLDGDPDSITVTFGRFDCPDRFW